MSGNCRPSLRPKTLENVKRSNLSITDKRCIEEAFRRLDAIVCCKDCFYYSQDGHTAYCLHPEYEHWYADGDDDIYFNPSTKENHFCGYGERKDGANDIQRST